ncbi:MAG: phosphoserine phosphatase SerB [Methanobacteriaceae archaeon]|nr:phosphoserine phosphatase SerB [Methanobacteriaceae archaeon]
MIKLIAFDFDNVLVDGESLDEVAKLVDSEDKIIELTRKAMEGNISFETSLRERMNLLKGVSLENIERVTKKMPLMEGAEEAILELKKRGYKLATITGNFEIITNRLKDLDIDYIFCNQLHDEDGKLTGEISGPLIVEGSKGEVLQELMDQEGLKAAECAAVGDGANDIPMLEKAGLSIAFNAKPALKEVADIVVEGKDLREILPLFESDTDDKIKGSTEEEPVKSENMSTLKDEIEPVKGEDIEPVREESLKVEDAGSVKDDLEPVKGEDIEPVQEKPVEDVTESAEADVKPVEDIAEPVKDVGPSEDVKESVKDMESTVDVKEPVKAEDVEPAKADVEPKTGDSPDVKEESKPPNADAGKSFSKLLSEKKDLEKNLKVLTRDRDALNDEAKTHKQLRDELNTSIKEILDKALEQRKERDAINQEVKKYKKLRDETNQELKKLEWSSGKRDIMKIRDEIKKLDKTIETKVLDIRKENELVKKVTDLQKKLQTMQEDENTQKEAVELKERSESYHAKVVELSDQAQETHEQMLAYFQKIDEIRTKADEAHAEFINTREKASAKHEEVKAILKEIRGKNKSLDKAKAKERNKEDRISHEKNIQEKEKAEEIYRKFRDGKKLSTDELLLLQKHNIV